MKRVVVTGLGTLNPLGTDINEFWKALCSGESGIGPITRFNTEGYATKIAGEVKGFDGTAFLGRKEAKKLDLFSQYAMAACMEAVDDAKLAGYDPDQLGVILGSGVGGFGTTQEACHKLFNRGPGRVMPQTIPRLICNIAAGNIAIEYDARGPNLTIVTACASGTDAIGNAFNYIRTGAAEVIITGGVEAPITELGVSAFNALHAMSTGFNNRPEAASRPFDIKRDGFVMGEGAGILILESLEHAEKRGAHIYGEIKGYGVSCDANNRVAPHPDGRGAAAAMEKALGMAGVRAWEVDYINAHATSTPPGDIAETLAIKNILGTHADHVKISATKSMTGHCLGASGAIETIAGLLSIRDGFIHPSINITDPDPDCDLDYVPGHGINMQVDTVLSNSFGFGGQNSCLLIKRFSRVA